LSAAGAGITDAADRLVWGDLPDLWRGVSEKAFSANYGSSCSAAVVVRRVGDSVVAGQFEVESRGTSGKAAATERAGFVLEPQGLPRGVTIVADLNVGASLTVAGSGIYAGGDVRGREQIAFVAGADGNTGPDFARPERWPGVAVHADRRIYAGGVEVHQAAVEADGDTDACTGDSAGLDPWPLSAEALILLSAHAVPAAAVSETQVDLAALATELPSGRYGEPQSGALVIVRSSGEPVVVTGWWPQTPDSPQVTLLIAGDAEIRDRADGAGAALRGALLVTGRLRVATPTLIVGCLAAGALDIEAPMNVVLPRDWAQSPPPGYLIAAPATGLSAGRFRDSQRTGPGRRTAGAGAEATSRTKRRLVVLTGVLPKLNTMLAESVRQCRGLLARRTAGRGPTLKQSCRLAEVGAGEAKGRSARGV
jgi:hypothetical protein